MDTENIRFYQKKYKILLYLLVCVIFIICACFMIIDKDATHQVKLGGYLGILFFGLFAIVFCFKLFNKTPYIEITPTNIKIYKFDKLWWKDIVSLRTFTINEYYSWVLEVKDISKYKLSFIQKINLYTGGFPFSITTAFLSKHDREQLKSILKYHIPQNDLD